MRFTTGLVIAAALLGVDAGTCGHRHHHHKGASSVAAQPTPAPAPVVEAYPTQPPVVEVPAQPEPQPETKPEPKPELPAPVSGLSSDEQGALDAHNAARGAVGVGPVTWDAGLAASALEWAQQLASRNALDHSGAGENLYMASGTDTPTTDATKSWLGEQSVYSGQVIDGSNYQEFGHYTQCVWKETTKIGVASAKAADGAVYVVGHYNPAGNMMGQAAY